MPRACLPPWGGGRPWYAPPRWGVRARRTKVFAIASKNRDRGGVSLAPPRRWRVVRGSPSATWRKEFTRLVRGIPGRRLWFKPCAAKKEEVVSPPLFLAPGQGFVAFAGRPRPGKANFAGVRLWQTPRFHRLLLLFPQIFCYAKSLREPCHRPTGLFSLRRADLSTNNSRANRLLYFGLRPRASRLRDASASGHPLLVAGANASTLKSLSYSCNGKRSRPKSTPFSVAQRQGLSSPLSTNKETRLF